MTVAEGLKYAKIIYKTEAIQDERVPIIEVLEKILQMLSVLEILLLTKLDGTFNTSSVTVDILFGAIKSIFRKLHKYGII